ncbi:MAG: plasmid partitioning protein RepA [Methylobacteriaceae bacterium]|nr:plasmid partitioning protein RepA [Methylobacteriaceae bacterium]
MTALQRLDQLVGEQASDLARILADHRAATFPPTAQKGFRRLTGAEVGKLLAVAESRVRQVATDNGLGQLVNGRRSYSLEDVTALRQALASGERTRDRYLPGRRQGEGLQIICTMNFKGGSGKTTTSAHLLQYLALHGYRALGVDLDPQASLSALFGIHSVIDLPPGATIYSALRYDDQRRPLRELIRPTYIPNLSFVPGGLELMEFEHETPRAFGASGGGGLVFDRLARSFQSVEEEFDVVVIDCPPQLGYLTLCGLIAATSVVITVHPEMLDVMSMTQFLAMLADVTGVIFDALPERLRPNYSWMRYLLTRFEPNDGPQAQMAALLRARFGAFVMLNATLKSTAISDAGLTNQTIYEIDRSQFIRGTYDRAIESVDAVNREIEDLILKAWGRS